MEERKIVQERKREREGDSLGSKHIKTNIEKHRTVKRAYLYELPAKKIIFMKKKYTATKKKRILKLIYHYTLKYLQILASPRIFSHDLKKKIYI